MNCFQHPDFSLHHLLLSPIHHTFGPHIDAAYMCKILAVSYAPHQYVRGKSIEKLRTALSKQFEGSTGLFASGRESLLALLQAMKLRSGEEIIVQGYTCVVVPNAIHAAGGVPVYADLNEETLNLTPESVEASLSPRTRAVICQHTFGIPSDTKKLRDLCDRHKILLIEDCAHLIPDETGPKEIGVLGDAVILSFGRDKAISGIAGGAVITRNPVFSDAIRSLESSALDLPWREVAKLLEYGSRMRCIVRPLSWCGLQKPILAFLNAIGLFSPILTENEREGHMSPLLRKLPNACAYLALHSLSRLREINDHRRMLTAFYLAEGAERGWPMLSGIHKDLPLQKFPLFVSGAKEKRVVLRKQNIHLDDGWTGCVVCPETVSITETGYEAGFDPNAEKVCKSILSLPTHPTMTLAQAKKLVERIDDLL